MKSFSIEAWKDEERQEVASGTTIGYTRILKIDPGETQKIRIMIRYSRACPLISNVEVYPYSYSKFYF